MDGPILNRRKAKGLSQPILIGSKNREKQILLRSLLDNLRNELNPVEPDQNSPAPIEDGDDHHSIAIEKARYWSKLANGFAISSDGGLLIPALKTKWDSTKTNRAAGENTSSQEKIHFLLSLMNGLDNEERRASWIESIAIAKQGELINVWTASSVMGYILPNSDGQAPDGLWTSSLHYFPEVKKTIKEMSLSELQLSKDPWTIIKRQIEAFSRDSQWFV